MKPLFTHLFWDFDGTLYDTYGQMTEAMLCALSDMGTAAQSAEVYVLLKVSVYHAACVLAERFSLPLQDLCNAFHLHHDQILGFSMYPGMDICIQALKKAGCKHYLYTHRNRTAIRQLEEDGLVCFFSGFVTREDGYPHKPAPDALEAMLQKYGVDPTDAVMIGDRRVDISAGHNAGMAGILFDPGEFFPEVVTEYQVQSMEEMTVLISRGQEEGFSFMPGRL